MVTESVNEILTSAATYACHSGLSCIDVSIIALATLQTNEVQAFLKENQISDQAICEEVCTLFDTLDKQKIVPEAGRFAMSPATMFVYKMGAGLARNLKKDFSPLHLLAGLTDGRPGDGHYHITQILEKHGLKGLDLYEYISYTNFIGGHVSEALELVKPAISDEVKDKIARIQAAAGLENCPTLQEFCENLIEKARAGRTDPVIGRDQEIGRTIRILSRRKKNNPILLGEPGVGKTAVAEELARLIVSGLVPHTLKDKIILSLDLGALVGGTKFRGDLEERLKKVLAEVKSLGNIILFIDEIHLLTGRLLDGCSDLFKPALANGELTAIGATTHAEYLQHFEKDAAMARRFQPVMVNEPDRNTSISIIRGLLPQYEAHHSVKFAVDVAEHAVDMAIRHIPRRALPDKAIDLIDEAGAVAVAQGKALVTKDAVDQVIHDMVGAGAAPFNPEEAMQSLRRKVVGQVSALETLEQFVRSVELRLVNGEARGALTLSGAEGVGKNHFVKCLAEATGSRLMELDGQQYQHESAIWRLQGVMPGYRDHEKGGQLTEALRRNPRTMLAVKNFELAHPDVQEMLISMIESGIITDSAKNPVSASDAYVVFIKGMETSSQIGFMNASGNEVEASLRGDLEELIDCHITLGQPGISELAELLDTMTQNLQAKLQKAGRDFEVATDLKEFILKVAEAADEKFNKLKQEFLTRIKSKLLSRPLEPGCSIILHLETGR
jgi:ATP-dependent Clp protease ATP-binding subunit ClpA